MLKKSTISAFATGDGSITAKRFVQADDSKAYQMQDAFTRGLLKAISPGGRQRIIGNTAPAS